MLRILRLNVISGSVTWSVSVLILLMVSSCHYFRINKSSAATAEEVLRLQTEGRYIILHLEDKTWHLTDITSGVNTLHGTISGFEGHQMYRKASPDKVVRYRNSQAVYEGEVINEAHIYVTELGRKGQSEVFFPVTAIKNVDVYEKAKGASLSSGLLSVLGVAGIGITVAGIIAAATSCPFVYVSDGENYHFSGEIFSGSVQPGLERDDYLTLPYMGADDGLYKINLKNELREKQFVNLAELWVFDHTANRTIITDKYGVSYDIGNVTLPCTAVSTDETDILSLICRKDSLSYSANKEDTGSNGITETTLGFIMPADAMSARLIIRAKNSFWLDGLIQNIHHLFGGRYSTYSAKQEKVEGDKLRKWSLDQKMPLSVYVWKNNKWKFADYFNLAGPMALKDDILSLDLEGIETDTVKIRLVTGFLFWEIDYAAIEFGKAETATPAVLQAKSAVANDDGDVRELIRANDNAYYILDKTGDESLLTFEMPVKKNETRSVILHSRGYYKIIREQSGEPDKKTLRTFRKPGRVPEFSREMFDSLTRK